MVSDAKYQLIEPHSRLTTVKPWGRSAIYTVDWLLRVATPPRCGNLIDWFRDSNITVMLRKHDEPNL